MGMDVRKRREPEAAKVEHAPAERVRNLTDEIIAQKQETRRKFLEGERGR